MKSKVMRGRDFRWDGVAARAYKDGGALFRDVTRHEILGRGDGEEGLRFETRYFEVAPGGFSTLERHEHPHVVIVIRGRGEVRLQDGAFPLAPFDVVFVAPREPHQFRATAEEPLGFLCIVDRDRDRPVPVRSEEEGN